MELVIIGGVFCVGVLTTIVAGKLHTRYEARVRKMCPSCLELGQQQIIERALRHALLVDKLMEEQQAKIDTRIREEHQAKIDKRIKTMN